MSHQKGRQGKASRCEAGMTWQWDGVSFQILHPDQSGKWQGNNGSCVVLVKAGAHRLLLTGDIEGAAERALLEGRKSDLGADLVTIPHHGSLTSSGAEFVEAVSPEYALASAGYRNRYGFPKSEVVDRWHSGGGCGHPDCKHRRDHIRAGA